jgi:hypothetical protein
MCQVWAGEGRTKTQRPKAPSIGRRDFIDDNWEGIICGLGLGVSTGAATARTATIAADCAVLRVICSILLTFFLLQTTFVSHNSKQKVSSQPYTAILLVSFSFCAYSSHLRWLPQRKPEKSTGIPPSTSCHWLRVGILPSHVQAGFRVESNPGGR